jgi:hypothetical protein
MDETLSAPFNDDDFFWEPPLSSQLESFHNPFDSLHDLGSTFEHGLQGLLSNGINHDVPLGDGGSVNMQLEEAAGGDFLLTHDLQNLGNTSIPQIC